MTTMTAPTRLAVENMCTPAALNVVSDRGAWANHPKDTGCAAALARSQNEAGSQAGTTRHAWTIARRFAHQDAPRVARRPTG
jgi:hypothetical protein